MKQARRKTDAKADDTVFHVFDVMPLADFQRGHCNAQFRKRVTAMNNLRPLLEDLSSVETMSHIIVDLDTDEGKQQIKTYSTKLKENLYRIDHRYDYIISISYNEQKTPNKGSAIFIHLTNDYKPTAGCIALKKKDFEILLKLINKKAKIKIG